MPFLADSLDRVFLLSKQVLQQVDRRRPILSLDRRVNLLFYAIVGRDDFNLPIITPALAEISKQLVQIKVEGGIDDPKITKEAVPVINEAIQQMFPELAARSQARTTVREEGKQEGRAFPLLRQSLERNGLTPKR